MQSKFATSSEQATTALAEKLMQKWLDVYGPNQLFLVLLDGDYGVGKTQFIKGAGKGAGVAAEIVSPSYVYIREYFYSYKGAVGNFVHVDAWRLKTQEDLQSIGLMTYLRPGNIVLVEWGGLLGQEWVNNDRLVLIKIKITLDAKNQRNIEVNEGRGWY